MSFSENKLYTQRQRKIAYFAQKKNELNLCEMAKRMANVIGKNACVRFACAIELRPNDRMRMNRNEQQIIRKSAQR